MKKTSLQINFILLLLLTMSACAQKRSLLVKVTYIQPYCGGARPTPEMEEDARKEKNYSNRMVIIVNTTGKVDSAMTDSSGYITKKVAFGNYKLFETWRYYKRGPNGENLNELDKECMIKEWNRPFATVVFGKKVISVNSEGPIKMQCSYEFPCTINKQPVPSMRQ